MLKYRTAIRLARFVLSGGSGLGQQSESRG
jgi:hypothetical protein